MNDLVSVIVPNYNHERFLPQRLDTIIAQKYKQIELILLDDHSTDGSRAIIERYRMHPKVSVISYNAANGGSVFLQWMNGLEKARGEWIWIAESDDYADPELVNRLLDPGIDERCGLRYCASNTVDEEGIVTGLGTSEIDEGVYSGIDFLKRFQLTKNHLPNASAVLVKRDLLKEALTEAIFRFKLYGDYLVYIKLMLQTDVYYCAQPLNYHRWHSRTVRSIMNKKGAHYEDDAAIRDEIDKLLNDLQDPQTRAELLKANAEARYVDKGFQAIELFRNGHYLRCLPPLLTATFHPRFNLYYLRSLLYWMRKRP